MRSSSGRLPKILTAIALLVLGALVLLGLLGQRQSEQTRAELEPQMAVAAQLLALQQSSEGAEGPAELEAAVSESLDTLAPAARDLAEVESRADFEEQLIESADALITLGLGAETAADRERALLSAVRIWQAAGEAGLTEQAYPPALGRELEGVEDFACQSSEGTSEGGVADSQAVLDLQDALGQLGFVSEVYVAREAQEYGEVAERAQTTALLADQLTGQLTPVLTCAGLLRAPAASYPLADPAEADAQLASLLGSVEANAQAALADQNLPVSDDEVEVLLVKTLLDAGNTR